MSVKLWEANHPADKTAFYAGGNINITAFTVLPEGEEEIDGSLTQSGSGWSVQTHFSTLKNDPHLL